MLLATAGDIDIDYIPGWKAENYLLRKVWWNTLFKMEGTVATRIVSKNMHSSHSSFDTYFRLQFVANTPKVPIDRNKDVKLEPKILVEQVNRNIFKLKYLLFKFRLSEIFRVDIYFWLIPSFTNDRKLLGKEKFIQHSPLA